MHINAGTLAMLTQAVNASFMTGLKHKSAPWEVVAMHIKSSTKENVYPYIRDIGGIRKWVGDRVLQNIAKGEFSLINEDYEQTESVERNHILDDQFGIYRPRFEQMGRNVTTFPSKYAYALLKAGFTTLGPDGQYFFDTDHPVGKPGAEASVSNSMGGAGEAWFIVDSSQVVKPIIYQERQSFDLVTMFNKDDPKVFFDKQFVYGVDGRAAFGFSPFWQLCFGSKQTLDATNVRATLVAMASQKSDAGEPLGVSGTHIVVSPALGETARDLFSKEVLSNGETNTLRGRLTVVESPWLL